MTTNSPNAVCSLGKRCANVFNKVAASHLNGAAYNELTTNETVILIELLNPSNYACFIPTGLGYKLFYSPAPDNIAFHYLESICIH